MYVYIILSIPYKMAHVEIIWAPYHAVQIYIYI